MCGRITFRALGKDLATLFDLAEAADTAPRYNISPTQPLLAVREAANGAGRVLVMLRWGLIPHRRFSFLLKTKSTAQQPRTSGRADRKWLMMTESLQSAYGGQSVGCLVISNTSVKNFGSSLPRYQYVTPKPRFTAQSTRCRSEPIDSK